jgi:hypothetical protein
VNNSWPNATDPSGHIAAATSAVVGAGIGAGLAVGGLYLSSWITGESVTTGQIWGAAVNGAIAGGIAGALAGSLTGDVSGLAIAAGGALGGAAGSATTQLIDKGASQFSLAEVGTSALAGGVGGAIANGDKRCCHWRNEEKIHSIITFTARIVGSGLILS